MRLDAKALATTFGVLWGGCVFLAALLNLMWPSYGRSFLDLVASIYPGFHPGTIGGATVGALYALLDGAFGGALVGWIYNRASSQA